MLGLEDLLGRKERVRVLRVLALWDGLNISRIRRLTGLSWISLDKTLRHLVEEGILQESKYPSLSSRYVRMFKYANTRKARILKRLFQEWENLTHKNEMEYHVIL
jgi:DNA-binding HxlR family transcriptional regulator